MDNQDFPAVYRAADQEAGRTQSLYFLMLWAQYLCLFLASALTLFAGYLDQTLLLVGYFFLLVSGAAAALVLGAAKPNQNWYRFRALAESCKTLSWRYMMGAAPFAPNFQTSETSALFAKRLHELVTFQPLDSARLIRIEDADEQATPRMQKIQIEPFEKRKAIYLEHRIENQLKWYKEKAKANQRAFKKSLFVIVFVYLTAMGATALQFYQPLAEGKVLWVAEPLLVLVASLLGYAQAKRYSELSASYALTALEIQKLRTEFLPINDDATFRSYVNIAEDAFSREHTQWIARAI
ncbi:DUF4231 domain-containing protein [Ruegeria sp. HKCCD6228]|uniref:DUF4231 domain-containing protein n=1 Tax=unclassified Ruegeria TaxID=2625375 RepID=UPI001487F50E|nr:MULTISPECIES: DUF4231 domain-containing protein [unclassified Ruegeria]NOD99839.1 DUF4231 domain-containing protein [Ruegeria sp. HKCCD6228]